MATNGAPSTEDNCQVISANISFGDRLARLRSELPVPAQDAPTTPGFGGPSFGEILSQEGFASSAAAGMGS